MVALANRVKVNTATAGTGTVTLGAASANNFFTFAEGGITNGQTVAYLIEEALDFEYGTGVYTSAGTTMTRATVIASKISGVAGTTKMTLAGAATVSIVALKEHFIYDGNANTTAVVGVGSIELGAASDTTVARTAAGRVTVEAVPVNTYTYSAAPPPGSAIAGDVWVDSDDLTEYTYVNDGDSSQWVNLSTAGTDTHPVTTVDNTVARYDGTGGYLQSSNVFVDDSDRISTGGSALQTLGSVIPQIQVLTPNVAGPGIATSSWVNSAFGAGVFMSHSRGTTVGDYTIVQNGDRLGIITCFGADGVDLDNNAANISFSVDGTPSSTAMPARITFSTRTSTSAPAERMRIDKDGRVGIGGTPISTLSNAYSNDNGGNFQLLGSSLTAVQHIVAWDAADGGPAELVLGTCSRNATVGTFTAVQAGDSLGSIGFIGSDGTNFEPAARITVKVDGTPGNDDMPGRIEFFTTRDGAVLPELKLTIPADGGLKFPATALASTDANTCDDYEEGTWTPVYVLSTVGTSSWTMSGGTAGKYIKIGGAVSIQWNASTTAFSLGSGTGNVRINGLPFAVGATNGAASALIVTVTWAVAASTPVSALAQASVSYIRLFKRPTTPGMNVELIQSDPNTGSPGNETVGSCTYFV